jgi:hypothetical protein
MGEVVKGSRYIQPLLRKYRQPLFDEEKLGAGVASNGITLFARRRGETDNAGHQKTERDTNLLANGALGAKQEHYLVGFNVMLDWDVLLVDAAAAAADAANNELNVIRLMMNDSLFRFRFGHSQPILEVPGERIPFGMGPHGVIDSNVTQAALQIAHVITNGVPSVREFFDVRLRKARPRHIQSEQNFTADWLFPNGAITLGTTSGGEYYRIMVYAVGILLSAL